MFTKLVVWVIWHHHLLLYELYVFTKLVGVSFCSKWSHAPIHASQNCLYQPNLVQLHCHHMSMIYVRYCSISPLHLGMRKRLHQVPLYVPVMSRDIRVLQSLYIGCPLTIVLLPVCSMIVGLVVGNISIVLIFPLQSYHFILTTCSNNPNNTPLVPISSNIFPW